MASDAGTELARRAPVSAGGRVLAIVPQSFDEAWRCAQLLAASGMTPKDIDTPEKVMATIMAGAEIGMAPFQALQSFAVINGRPALWGDGLLGVVRARGVKVHETLEGEGESMVARCTVTRPDGEEVTRSFSVDDAKRAGLWKKAGPWTAYPQRMLQMRARAWAIRDACADITRGIQMIEEAQDVEVRSNVLISNGAAADDPSFDQRPGEEVTEERSAFIGGEAWNLVLAHYTKLFDEADGVDDLDAIWKSFQRKYWIGKRRCISDNSYAGIAEMHAGQVANRLRHEMCGIDDLAQLEEWFSLHESRLDPSDLEVYAAKQAELIAEQDALVR